MNKFYKIIFVLIFICSFLLGINIDETNPIPAIYVTQNISEIIDSCLINKYYPIAKLEFLQGNLAVPKKYIPIVIITNSQQALITDDQITNFPVYHKEYDPLIFYAFEVNNALQLNKFLNKKNNQTFFVSDGKANIISVPKNKINSLFLYAPTNNMQIKIFGKIPWLSNKYLQYPSKTERFAKKRTAKKGYHVTYKAINSSKKVDKIIAELKEFELDSIIIDFKSYYHNKLNVFSSYKEFMNFDINLINKNLAVMQTIIDKFKDNNITVSLRIVIALDKFLNKYRPDLMLWDKKTNKPWKDNYKQTWIDLSQIDVLKYYSKIFKIALSLSPDELQLDYIRFPSEGKIQYLYSKAAPLKPKYKIIQQFLNMTAEMTNAYNVALAADIFGIVVWQLPKTREILGQDVHIFLRYVDSLCPMLYPSHFHKGFENIAYPGAKPYLLIKLGCDKLAKVAKNHASPSIQLIPWIQAFNYKSPGYSYNYIQQQIRAAKKSGMDGFLAWNSKSDYTIFVKPLTNKRIIISKKSNLSYNPAKQTKGKEDEL